MHYFTCDRNYVVVGGKYLKILLILQYGDRYRVNLLKFHFQRLKQMPKAHQFSNLVLQHHGLIILICKYTILALENEAKIWGLIIGIEFIPRSTLR